MKDTPELDMMAEGLMREAYAKMRAAVVRELPDDQSPTAYRTAEYLFAGLMCAAQSDGDSGPVMANRALAHAAGVSLGQQPNFFPMLEMFVNWVLEDATAVMSRGVHPPVIELTRPN